MPSMQFGSVVWVKKYAANLI